MHHVVCRIYPCVFDDDDVKLLSTSDASQDGRFVPHCFDRILPFTGQHSADCSRPITLQSVTVVVENGELPSMQLTLNHYDGAIFR